MKKIIYLLLLFSAFANAQIVNIPDVNFKTRLISLGVDSNSDGNIQNSEASSIITLDLNYANIADITGIESFVNLKTLYCDHNYFPNLNLTALVDLERLFCQWNEITTLNVSGLINLKEIWGAENQITSVNLTGLINLEFLNLAESQLTSLDVSALSSLIGVSCHNNQITSLNVVGLSNLVSLSCDGNQLTSLDLNGLPNLKQLSCAMNQLPSLNVSSLINLKHLYCGLNQLTFLDVSNLNLLETLSCGHNQFTVLNLDGLTNLTNLSCRNNQLSVLTLSGVNLWSFDCLNNQLVDINVSSMSNLEYLYCGGNNILNLDCSNNSLLAQLYVNNSLQLQYIYAKNGSNEAFTITNVPNLLFICNDEEQIDTIQSLVNSNVVVNSYCTFTPGGNINTITGSIIYDGNGNGCEITDLPQPNIKIEINDGVNQGSTFTNNSGNYKFYMDAGSFAITPNMENPAWFVVSPTSVTIPFANDNNNVVTQNFCITPNGIHPDLEIVVAPIVPARPGFDAIYKIVYKNKGNQTLSQAYGVNFFYNENVMDYVSASVAPTSINSGGLSWSYANLLPFESRSVLVTFSINAPTDTPPVNIGDDLQFTASILPMAGDESTSDNTFLYNQTVVGAYDPNNIICMEGNVVPPSEIGNYLHYVINFENTGNYEAENIVVKTEINPLQFDVSSLRMLDTSHNAYVRIKNNIVEFVFENIALQSGGHGNILLKIKSKSNLTNGSVVNKRADIFFDYNAPIDTGFENTVYQALSNSSFEKDNSISIYPNPTNSLINIKCENNIKSIELYDVQGRVLVTKMVSDNKEILDISDKANGIYFLKITSQNGIKVEKLIKE